MKSINNKPDFAKYSDGLVPAIVQDNNTDVVLMLGFVNEESFNETQRSGKVCFFSRSKQRLWTKGEESGNFLSVRSILTDCDNDTVLIKAIPAGPVCHTGADTCFGETNSPRFLKKLENIIAERQQNPSTSSYVSTLFSKGVNAIAQKVGEEAVELVIESKDDNDDRFLNEAADLLFHYLVLLRYKGRTLEEVEEVLRRRQ
jgi:phosphoribosyl-ATP pyrophosphohydrolase/phosphoribosyl-AMP cyclohydrolase